MVRRPSLTRIDRGAASASGHNSVLPLSHLRGTRRCSLRPAPVVSTPVNGEGDPARRYRVRRSRPHNPCSSRAGGRVYRGPVPTTGRLPVRRLHRPRRMPFGSASTNWYPCAASFRVAARSPTAPGRPSSCSSATTPTNPPRSQRSPQPPTTTGTASWPYPPPTAARKPTSRTRAVKRRARFGVGGQQRRRPLVTSS